MLSKRWLKSRKQQETRNKKQGLLVLIVIVGKTWPYTYVCVYIVYSAVHWWKTDQAIIRVVKFPNGDEGGNHSEKKSANELVIVRETWSRPAGCLKPILSVIFGLNQNLLTLTKFKEISTNIYDMKLVYYETTLPSWSIDTDLVS